MDQGSIEEEFYNIRNMKSSEHQRKLIEKFKSLITLCKDKSGTIINKVRK